MARPITFPAGPTPERRDIRILSGEETVISRSDDLGPLILTVSETSSGEWIERLTGTDAVSVADQPGIAAMTEGREYHYNLWRDNGAAKPDLLAKGRIVREGTIEPGDSVSPQPGGAFSPAFSAAFGASPSDPAASFSKDFSEDYAA